MGYAARLKPGTTRNSAAIVPSHCSVLISSRGSGIHVRPGVVIRSITIHPSEHRRLSPAEAGRYVDRARLKPGATRTRDLGRRLAHAPPARMGRHACPEAGPDVVPLPRSQSSPRGSREGPAVAHDF